MPVNKCPYNDATNNIYTAFPGRANLITIEEINEYVKDNANLNGGICSSGNLLTVAITWGAPSEILQHLI